MLAIAERRAKPKGERFDRPLRDGPVFLHHFPALRTGLLSLSPFLLRPAVVRSKGGLQATADKPGQVLSVQSEPLKLTRMGSRRTAKSRTLASPVRPNTVTEELPVAILSDLTDKPSSDLSPRSVVQQPQGRGKSRWSGTSSPLSTESMTQVSRSLTAASSPVPMDRLSGLLEAVTEPNFDKPMLMVS
jgi:hypothetical protein